MESKDFKQELERISRYAVTPEEFTEAVSQKENPAANLIELADELAGRYPQDKPKVEAILARAAALGNMIDHGLPGVSYDPDLGHACLPNALLAAASYVPMASLSFGVGFDENELISEMVRLSVPQGRA